MPSGRRMMALYLGGARSQHWSAGLSQYMGAQWLSCAVPTLGMPGLASISRPLSPVNPHMALLPQPGCDPLSSRRSSTQPHSAQTAPLFQGERVATAPPLSRRTSANAGFTRPDFNAPAQRSAVPFATPPRRQVLPPLRQHARAALGSAQPF